MNKNCIINFGEKTITLTKAFFKQAQILGTTENHTLLDLLKQFPDFKVNEKAPANRENYKGLTIPFMKKCVFKEYGGGSVAKFEEMIDLFAEHPAYYGKVKAVFFKDYPKCKALIKDTGIEIDEETAETADENVIDGQTELTQTAAPVETANTNA